MQGHIENELLHNYLKQINSYDEVLDSNGNVKPHWKSLFDVLGQIGIPELQKRNVEIIRKLRENGVTYNVYGSTDGLNRQWQLDPIPFLMTRDEWGGINKGLFQRAQLQDLILKDLYGPGNLIKDKIIPPELLFANSSFLRQCNDVKLKSKHQLLIYAADMARGPDGRMWVLDNRTQTPSGFGYAFENRKVLSRIIPELAQNFYVDRISPFYHNFQKSFYKLSNSVKEQPFVVFLTPGPHNETYFEQAFLSSYLGCTLVQGEDLLVREGFVWLKSIEGLQKVDVIIRRVDDDFVDPLELRLDSRLGIPGLLQVIRKGNIVVINPPGTAILENHGFMAFGNNICKYFLGEELILPSVATWWCGQPKEMNFVLDNIERLIVKNVNRKQKFRSVYGRLISKAERDELKQRIIQHPHEFVAQEEVQLSTTPSFTGNGIEPRLAAIRSFIISDGDEYFSMQGGLTRNSPEKDRFLISNQYGGQSKDTWIVADSPELNHEKPNTNNSIANPKENALSSRSAENLYWSGRYCERINIISKILINLINTLNTHKRFGDTSREEHIDVLLKSITHLTSTYPGFLKINLNDSPTEVYKELFDVISNSARVGSVTSNISNFLRATISIRERLTIGTFRIIDLIDEVNNSLKNQNNNSLTDKQTLLEKLNTRIFTFYGIVNETMTRDSGMLLFEIGKLLERCHSLINQIRSCACSKYEESVEEEMLETLLLNNHSLVRYRSKYKTAAKIELFLDMTLFEVKLPHSITNQLNRISECIDGLPKLNHSGRLNEAQKIILEAITLIQRSDLTELCQYDSEDLFRDNLDKRLSLLDDHINTLSLTISNIYFNHTIPTESFLTSTEDQSTDEI